MGKMYGSQYGKATRPFITILFGVLMLWKGKTYKGPYAHIATKRDTEIQQLFINQPQGISNGE